MFLRIENVMGWENHENLRLFVEIYYNCYPNKYWFYIYFIGSFVKHFKYFTLNYKSITEDNYKCKIITKKLRQNTLIPIHNNIIKLITNHIH